MCPRCKVPWQSIGWVCPAVRGAHRKRRRGAAHTRGKESIRLRRDYTHMDRLLSSTGGTPLRPVHAMPGRLRLKAGPSTNGSGPFWALRDALASHDGIAYVEYRPASQSFIIRYDPERWSV